MSGDNFPPEIQVQQNPIFPGTARQLIFLTRQAPPPLRYPPPHTCPAPPPTTIPGIDLSPYFLAVATLRAESGRWSQVTWRHADAEATLQAAAGWGLAAGRRYGGPSTVDRLPSLVKVPRYPNRPNMYTLVADIVGGSDARFFFHVNISPSNGGRNAAARCLQAAFLTAPWISSP